MRQSTVACLAFAVATTAAAGDLVHHDLRVELSPAAHRLAVVDRITLADDLPRTTDGALTVTLHAGLAPTVVGSGWRLEPVADTDDAAFQGIDASPGEDAAQVPVETFRLVPVDGAGTVVELSYGGDIDHPLATQGEEYQRSFAETPGLISADGVFLAGATHWVPELGADLVTFSLTVTGLEPPWQVVSQGARGVDAAGHPTWTCSSPSEEVYLVAGPWHEYRARPGRVEALAFLRSDDPALASKYLDATARYLKLYEGLIGPFPYPSFALVENFWETGYGMPGFTLLGPQVIRFPWILTSSYPHELLHNWWGNSVYVDYDHGNWCEGLTAYLADHLFAEQKGQAEVYRRATLKKFTDFVSTGEDFPLTAFSSRRSAATEAIGYGKSLMLFHMLRREAGDEGFVAALRAFAAEHRFARASFADLARAFSTAAGRDLAPFVATWTARPGAPRLALAAVDVEPVEADPLPWQLTVTLRQEQVEEPFPLTVPVAVTLEGQSEPEWLAVTMTGRSATVRQGFARRPLRLDVDPAFDVMRRLDPREVPPALSTVLGADDALFVLPAAAAENELAAWRELARAWAAPGEPRLVLDRDLAAAPDESAWILGWGNRYAAAVTGRLAPDEALFGPDAIALAGDRLERAELSLVLVARAAGDPDAALGLVAADPVAAIPGLARKLPHYSRYSYLAFKGEEPTNVAKGLWQPTSSPLVRNLGGGPLPSLALPTRTALAELPPAFDAAALMTTVRTLADPALEGRGLGSSGLERATAWVEGQLAAAALEPAGDDGFRQSWAWSGGEPERAMTLTNLVARVPGSDPSLPPVLLLAHLDHLGRGWPDARAGHAGQVHPGADDNASGVAVLLELARTLKADSPRPRAVLVAAVTGEEAGLLGSRHLLASLAGGLPMACVNLDTVGRLKDGKLYVLDAASAREWRFIVAGVGSTTGAPVAVVAEPLDASDQAACLELGVPAVQLFTGPTADYHRPSDTPDTVDSEGLVTVTEATHETVAYLAERREPLTVTIAGRASDQAAAGPTRSVSLGTVPDFAFPGPGVRIDEILADSPAAAAGLRSGDVVIRLGQREVVDLRSYSEALKAQAPGDTVEVVVRRDGAELTVSAVLVAR